MTFFIQKSIIATRNSEKSDTIEILQQAGYFYYVIDSLVNLLEFPSDIHMALVDEDFDGSQTGWHLASKIRQTNYPIKIVMIVRKNPERKLLPLYDVIWSLPFSAEALIGEIRRK